MTTAIPSGNLAARSARTVARLSGGGYPAFSDAFVLADTRRGGNNPRRFSEFSGDVSGRFLGALARLGEQAPMDRLGQLGRAALAEQHDDGRFGDGELVWDASAIGPRHMAQLWGNGRLLVGLLELHAVSGDPALLAGARRLGAYVARTTRACLRDEVRDRLRDHGAFGVICVGQLAEPLALLARADGDATMRDLAVSLVPWLPPRPGQHAHGWLTTLRGALLVAEDTGDAALLARIVALADEVAASPDLGPAGGVPEYFGGDNNRAIVESHSGGHIRDETCAEADWVRLCLHLWRITGESRHRARGLWCLRNQLFAGQFPSGDFGHRILAPFGMKPVDNVGRAWWCCTMHGLTAIADAAAAAVVRRDGEVRIEAWIEARLNDAGAEVELAQTAYDRFTVRVVRASPGQRLVLLRPDFVNAWSVNGIAAGERVELPLQAGPVVVEVSWAVRLRLADGSEKSLSALGPDPVRGELRVGPWLLAVHGADDPEFIGEPWSANRIALGLSPCPQPDLGDATEPAWRFPYRHQGFVEPGTCTLRPLSWQYRCDHAFTVWNLEWQPAG